MKTIEADMFLLLIGTLLHSSSADGDINAAAPICFANGDCYDLTTYLSSEAERAQLDGLCAKLTSPFYSRCENWKIDGKWSWESDQEGLGYRVQEIPGMITEYSEDLQALLYNTIAFQASKGGYLPSVLGPDAKGIVPDRYRIPLILVSSAINRLRDLPPSEKKKLWYPGNPGPQPVNLDPKFPDSTVVFHGAEWFQDFCNVTNAPQSQRFINIGSTSTATNMPWASMYAGEEGSMWVWLTDTIGNQPFTGEYEFLMMPGGRMKQIGCDVYPPPLPPYKIGDSGFRTISFAYETTRRGELSPLDEVGLLSTLKEKFYNYSSTE